MKFILFRKLTLKGWQWYFRMVASNGRTVAQSEGYRNRLDAVATIDSIRDRAGSALVEVAR